ncbi:hypothetical protein GW17_00034993 [Ensete ventricosum]|nr:hypothetical protein GW17_00034993 [Ensete ventricosum]
MHEAQCGQRSTGGGTAVRLPAMPITSESAVTIRPFFLRKCTPVGMERVAARLCRLSHRKVKLGPAFSHWSPDAASRAPPSATSGSSPSHVWSYVLKGDLWSSPRRLLYVSLHEAPSYLEDDKVATTPHLPRCKAPETFTTSIVEPSPSIAIVVRCGGEGGDELLLPPAPRHPLPSGSVADCFPAVSNASSFTKHRNASGGGGAHDICKGKNPGPWMSRCGRSSRKDRAVYVLIFVLSWMLDF